MTDLMLEHVGATDGPPDPGRRFPARAPRRRTTSVAVALAVLLTAAPGAALAREGDDLGHSVRARASVGAVARDVRELPGPATSSRADKAPRRLQVVYSAFVQSSFDVYVADAGMQTRPRTLVGTGFHDNTPVLSRGGRLYWTRYANGSSRFQLWTASAAGRKPTRIRPPGCEDCVLSWPSAAVDGRRVAFSRGNGSTGCTVTQDCDELVVHDLRSGASTVVGYGVEADWSPRRDEIVYSGHETSTGRNAACAPASLACPGGEIRIVDVSGAAPVSRAVGAEIGHFPRFSPDGDWIVFERSFASSSARRVSVVMRRDGTDKRVLTACAVNPSWTPDGRLACIVRVPGGGEDVFVLDEDDRPDAQLTFTPETEHYFRLYER